MLDIWTVYRFPADYPDQYVARRFAIDSGRPLATDDIVKATTLDGVREQLPPGLFRMGRQAGDDYPIVESWL